MDVTLTDKEQRETIEEKQEEKKIDFLYSTNIGICFSTKNNLSK